MPATKWLFIPWMRSVIKFSDADFKNVIMASKEKHERLGNEIHAQLEKCDDPVKEPNALSKGNVLAENKCQVSS